jgi:hypothetical protein
MQDRHRQFDEIFLQRTAGPYIRSGRIFLAISTPILVRRLLITPTDAGNYKAFQKNVPVKTRDS